MCLDEIRGAGNEDAGSILLLGGLSDFHGRDYS